jgi:hypothetical protein
MAGFNFDMQAFLNAAGFGQPQEEAGIPEAMPVRQPALPNRLGPSIAVPNAYQEEYPGYDEEVFADVEQPMSTLEAFRQNVMNPPKRTHMTYPKNTLAGLQKGLELLAEDSPTKKNRVYIDGKAHQKAQWFKDPQTGEKRFITVKDPSFADQVLKTLPAATSPAIDILNQQREDEIADWELKNKGLAAASKAESEAALAEQRRAQAEYTGGRGGREQEKIDISRLTAEEKVRASRLNTMTDAQKIAELQAGRVSLADLNNAAAMKRTEVQQAGATQRTGMQQTGANQRVAAQQAGANWRTQQQQAGADRRSSASIAGAQKRVETAQAGATERSQAGITSREKIAAGKGTGAKSETQRRIETQRRAAEFISQNPDMEGLIEFDARGFPIVSDDADDQTGQIIFDHIYGQPGQDINLPAERPAAAPIAPAPTPTTTAPPAVTTKPTTTAPPKPTTKSTTTTPPKAPDTSKQPQVMRKTMPDGTVVERTVPAQHIQAAKAQGFK